MKLMTSTLQRTGLPARTPLLVVMAFAVLLGGGCATVKRLVPWGGSDEAAASNATSGPSTRTEAPSADSAATDKSATEKSANGKSDGRLDLSLPAASAPAAGSVAIRDTARSVPPKSGDVRDDDASDWSTAIQAAVHRNWLRPSGPQIPVDFSCDVLVTLTRSGLVEAARIVRSCGHATLDASVLSAVQAASPLPLPVDMDEFGDSLLITFTPR